MKVAYGVRWRQADGEQSGRLVIAPGSLQLVSLKDRSDVLEDLPFEDIRGIEVRAVEDAPGRSVVVLESRASGRVEIESATGRLLLVELLEHAFRHVLEEGPPKQELLVAIRLKPGCREAARELLRAGPPFHPSETRIAAHDVFVLGDDILFFFETEDVGDLSEEPQHFWDAVAAWQDLIADVQVAERAYTWTREELERPHPSHPGLGF